MILVTGATGTVGREVVAQLVAAGKPVRALTRDPAKAKFDAKVQVVKGDFDQPDTLAKAAAGTEAVFSLSGGAQLPQHEANLAAAAKKAGAKRLVKLSVLGAGQNVSSPITAWHEAGEKAIQDSGLAWTFVRPGMFMSNALQWAGMIKSTGKVFLPYGDGRVPPVHPRDIAAVAVAALTGDGHAGKSYPLTGPEALTAAQMVQAISEAAGKPIAYVAIDDATARDNMLKAGLPEGLVSALVKMAGTIRDGQAQTVLPTVEQVLGRKALTFKEWAAEHAAAFR